MVMILLQFIKENKKKKLATYPNGLEPISNVITITLYYILWIKSNIMIEIYFRYLGLSILPKR